MNTMTFATPQIQQLVQAGTEFRCDIHPITDTRIVANGELMAEWVLEMERCTGNEAGVDFRVGSDWYRLQFVNVCRTRLHVTGLSRVYGF